MIKLKKYLIAVVLVSVVGSGFLIYPKEKAAAQYMATGKAVIVVDLERPQVVELDRQALLMSDAIKQMVAAGLPPEKITFTGEQSPNDLFGSGKVDAKALVPPPKVCSSFPCIWKVLPAKKKDYGWYVYGVGTSSADIIAYIKGVDPALCGWMEAELPNPYIKRKQVGASFDPEKPGVYSPEGGPTTIKTARGALDGQLEGCFDNRVGDGPKDLIYYHVLLAQ